MVRHTRVVLITTKLLEHFGHEIESFGWSIDECGDMINRCTRIDCLQQFTLFTPFPDLATADRVWRLMNSSSYDGFHFNEGMEYQDIKTRVLYHHITNLYCSCH